MIITESTDAILLSVLLFAFVMGVSHGLKINELLRS
jgi:hypothetical protein